MRYVLCLLLCLSICGVLTSQTYITAALCSPIGQPFSIFLASDWQNQNFVYRIGIAWGSTPGQNIGVVNVPLNNDSLFQWGQAVANTPTFLGAVGLLTPTGFGAAVLKIPRDPALVGYRYAIAGTIEPAWAPGQVFDVTPPWVVLIST